MSLQQAIIDAVDTVAMVAYFGGDVQGQFVVEVGRICDSGQAKKNICEKQIKDLLARKYDIEVDL